MASRKRIRLEEKEIDGVLVLGKLCVSCEMWKPLKDFHNSKGRTGGKASNCKDCMKIIRKKYCDKNKDSIKEYNKTYYKENKDEVKVRVKY
jgi:hypothetical protein